jgi:4-hydroxyphenylacetate 3-monooxygenase
MIRTGALYQEGLRDGSEVWIDGERVRDVATHPALQLMGDIRAHMCDMQHEQAHARMLTYVENDARNSIFNRLPKEQRDWHDQVARRRRRHERHWACRDASWRGDRWRDAVAL